MKKELAPVVKSLRLDYIADPVKAKALKQQVIQSNRSSSFLLIVALPLVLLSFYYAFMASDRYVSTASFKIYNAGGGSADLSSSAAAFAAVAGVTAQNDEYIIQSYVLSMDMLRIVEEKLNLREHYSSHPDADIFSRMSSDTSMENFLAFYQDHIYVHYDEYSGLLTVEVQAFEPKYAEELLTAILKASEEMVNDKGRQLAESKLQFMREEIKRSEKRLSETRMKLLMFQSEYGVINPEQQGQTVGSIITSLEVELASAQAKRTMLMEYQHQGSPQISALGHQIEGLKKQIIIENNKLAQDTGSKSMSALFSEYKELELEALVAQESYAASLATLEMARIEVTRKLKHLVVINSPFTPDEALYPQKMYNLLTVAVLLMMLFGIIRMLLATIKEHQD